MSATTRHTEEAVAAAAARPSTVVLDPSRIPQAEPHRPDPTPPTSPDYSEGRHAVARGSGVPQRVRVSVKIQLDYDQTEWLERESERTGRTFTELLTDFLERERATRP
jgi:hypothetical protein